MAVKQNVQVVVPELPPDTDPKLRAWWQGVKYALDQIFPQLLSNVNELVDGKTRILQFRVLVAAPLGAATGMVAYADGTVWNPGAGEGLYEYRSDAAWHKL